MTRLETLRDQRNQTVADMRAILAAAEAEDRDLSEEEAGKYDALKDGLPAVDQQIARIEEQDAIEAALQEVRPAAARRQTPDNASGDPARREFENFGEFLAAVRFNPDDQRLTFHEFDPTRPQAALEMGTGSSGGFMVPQQFRAELLRVDPQAAVIRPRATVIPAGTPPDAAITMPALDQTGDVPNNVYGGVTVVKTAEGGTKQETTATLRQITLEPHEFAGWMEATDKLLRNWPAASALIEQLFRQAMMATEDTEFLSGNGIGGPLGILNAGAIYTVTRGTASTVKFADVSAMIARLLMRGGSPIWMASQSIMPQLMTMRNEIGSPATGDGALIWQPSAREGEPDRLFGRPIVWHERSPQLGTTGDLVLADLSYYLIKDGSGPFVAASEHVEFKANKTVFKIFWNVDGQPWLTAPFKQEGGYQVSPFVVLGAA